MTELPLRVVVTRRIEQAAVLGDQLRGVGLTPVIFPTIRLTALPTGVLDATLAELSGFDWLIFTSVNAVEFFFRRAHELGDVDGVRSANRPAIAVVGSATAHALAQRGFQPDFMPSVFTGVALAAELSGTLQDTPPGGGRQDSDKQSGLGHLPEVRILLPRAQAGGRAIVDSLRARGAVVTDIALYATVTATPTSDALAELAQGFEAITFASPSSVRGFLEIVDRADRQLASLVDAAVIACIGPVTAQAARDQGLTVTLTPDEYTLDALVQSLAQYYA